MFYNEDDQEFVDNHDLTEPFDFNYEDYFEDYEIISRWSNEFIHKMSERIDWDFIATYAILNEDFIIEFKEKLDLDLVSRHQNLSLDFIEKYHGELNLGIILRYQKSLERPSALRESLGLIARI